MIDIDDTLINNSEKVEDGFEFMKAMYDEISLLLPIYIVTARPRNEHINVMTMLKGIGFCIPPDRLRMLPTEMYYNGNNKDVEEFKWGEYMKISRLHNGVVARLGDKMWDVAHIHSLRPESKVGRSRCILDLSHVPDRACYMFMDPNLNGTVSAKLPGFQARSKV